MITYSNNTFIWSGSYSEKDRPKEAGFKWHPGLKKWYTKNPLVGYNLIAEADLSARHALRGVFQSHLYSNLIDSANGLFSPRVPAPDGLSYLPFQEAGIWAACRRLKGHQAVGIFDAPGIGKTIQAIGVLNELNFKKVLVVCPAFLRYNWYSEMKKWWRNFDEPNVIFSGKDPVGDRSVICSYDLAGKLSPGYDVVIIDESHRLKNYKAQRTRKILTNKNAVINGAKVIALTGTPLPNGKPEEAWTILSNLAPDVVSDFRNKWDYIYRYCVVEEDYHGKIITGVQRHEELGNRLRGSGFMIRRLKSEVLTQLPDKRHNMILVDPVGKARTLLKKESAFSVEEITKWGTPNGSGLPELRRELGLTKIDLAVEVIKEMLNSGVHKLIVGAYHRDVVNTINVWLNKSGITSSAITGSVGQKERNNIVRYFQNIDNSQILIGQINAMGEGLTLTAASDVLFVEEPWVPGESEQFSDRCHRIGQKNAVNVHHLVYKDSLDAKIFATHTEKSVDSKKIIG